MQAQLQITHNVPYILNKVLEGLARRIIYPSSKFQQHARSKQSLSQPDPTVQTAQYMMSHAPHQFLQNTDKKLYTRQSQAFIGWPPSGNPRETNTALLSAPTMPPAPMLQGQSVMAVCTVRNGCKR